MTTPRLRVTLVAIVGVIGIAVACHQKPAVKRVLPMVNSGLLSELTESTLAAIVVCHDTLGRLDHETCRALVRCTPCIPYGMQADDKRSIAHARKLWLQGARTPYDTLDLGVSAATTR